VNHERASQLLSVAALIAVPLAACAVGDPQVADRTSSVIYGADDRTEYFDVAAPEMQARMAQSMVALVVKSVIGSPAAGYPLSAPSWQDARMLCPGTRFADQPAAAFCTGVLVDWDLVLTAGHCMRAFARQDIAVMFGYYYAAPGVLAVDGVGEIGAIVAEALDPEGVEPRLDYAWLRLKQVARAPHKPAPIHVRLPQLTAADPLVSIGAGGGIPLKLDTGGHVQDPRVDIGDYFFADTDTFGGGSGGGAFDTGMALLGILARGGTDFVLTTDGCNQVVQQPDGAAADEQFTYASSAVEALCARGASASTICRTDCPSPCEALPPEASTGDGASGCAVAGTARGGLAGLSVVPAILLARGRRTRRRSCDRARQPGTPPRRLG
jgi:hypothetical protein